MDILNKVHVISDSTVMDITLHCKVYDEYNTVMDIILHCKVYDEYNTVQYNWSD